MLRAQKKEGRRRRSERGEGISCIAIYQLGSHMDIDGEALWRLLDAAGSMP